jgi:hypothetical protein
MSDYPSYASTYFWRDEEHGWCWGSPDAGGQWRCWADSNSPWDYADALDDFLSIHACGDAA